MKISILVLLFSVSLRFTYAQEEVQNVDSAEIDTLFVLEQSNILVTRADKEFVFWEIPTGKVLHHFTGQLTEAENILNELGLDVTALDRQKEESQVGIPLYEVRKVSFPCIKTSGFSPKQYEGECVKTQIVRLSDNEVTFELTDEFIVSQLMDTKVTIAKSSKGYHLYNSANGDSVAFLQPKEKYFTHYTESKDGKFLITYSSSQDSYYAGGFEECCLNWKNNSGGFGNETGQLWDMKRLELLKEFKVYDEYPEVVEDMLVSGVTFQSIGDSSISYSLAPPPFFFLPRVLSASILEGQPYVYTIMEGGIIKLYDKASGRFLREFNTSTKESAGADEE